MSTATPTYKATRIRPTLTGPQRDRRNELRRKRAAEARKAKTATTKKVTAKKETPRKKTKRATNLKGRKTRTDWDSIIYKLQHGPKRTTVRRVCSTPGVAQVTRVRLLDAYEGIEAETKGTTLILSRA